MKVLLDTCVLFPTVLREVLLAVAGTGLYQPLTSERITEEWRRAAAKHGPEAEAEAMGARALMGAHFPRAMVAPRPSTEARLWLPDPNDIHVLAAAIDGGADLLVTLNLRDFPRASVRDEGLEVQNPDAFLYDLWLRAPEVVARAVEGVRLEASRLSGQEVALRPLLKRARLPKLGKVFVSK